MYATPPAAAVVVTHDVVSFDRWKVAFDRHAEARRIAGVVATHINRDADAPDRLSVYIAGSDAAKLAAILKSPDLASTMLDAGVKSPPSITAVTPVEDQTQKPPQVPFCVWVAARRLDSHEDAIKRAAAGDRGVAVLARGARSLADRARVSRAPD